MVAVPVLVGLTDRAIWHLVVSGMALASGQSMKPFDDHFSAQRWLGAAQ